MPYSMLDDDLDDLDDEGWKYEVWNPDEGLEDLGYAELDIEELQFFDLKYTRNDNY